MKNGGDWGIGSNHCGRKRASGAIVSKQRRLGGAVWVGGGVCGLVLRKIALTDTDRTTTHWEAAQKESHAGEPWELNLSPAHSFVVLLVLVPLR